MMNAKERAVIWLNEIYRDSIDVDDEDCATYLLDLLAKQEGMVSIPPGYVLVPVEPTEEMIEAGLDILQCEAGAECAYGWNLSECPNCKEKVRSLLQIHAQYITMEK